jgi:hypothetical protein
MVSKIYSISEKKPSAQKRFLWSLSGWNQFIFEPQRVPPFYSATSVPIAESVEK